MTRRNLPGSGYSDVPDATIMGGNFTPWLLPTKMTYAPAFKNGTVFEPGTLTHDAPATSPVESLTRTTRFRNRNGSR